MLKIELNLSADDLQSLVDALERYVSDLSMEIADTDTMDYREKLKSQRIALYKALDQIKKTFSE